MKISMYSKFGEVSITVVDDWNVFFKLAKRRYDIDIPLDTQKESSGIQCKDIIYIEDIKDMNTMGHELIHVIDYYIAKRGFLLDDTEVRAHLFSFFIDMYVNRIDKYLSHIAKFKQHKRKK